MKRMVQIILTLILPLHWPSIIMADAVSATYEFHQLTNFPNGIELSPSVIAGETIYFARANEDDTKVEVLAVNASGGQPRVVDTWDKAKYRGIYFLSYADGVIAANPGIIQKNGQTYLALTEAAITGLERDLFSVNSNAVIKDTSVRLSAGVYRASGNSPQPILLAAQIANAIGVDPRFVTRIPSFSCSRDGSRIACMVMVESEHPDIFPKVGHWFLTYDGGNITIMNPDGKPYRDVNEASMAYSVSGDGKLLIWSDYNRKDVRIGAFGERGGNRFCSSDEYPGIASGLSKFRFFYIGDRLAVLFGSSGTAKLVDGQKPFDMLGTGAIFSRDTFNAPYIDETSDGLFSFHLPINGRQQLALFRLNSKPEKLRSDAPAITQYSVNPPFISNDSSRPAIQTARVLSNSPILVVAPCLRKVGFETTGDTAHGGMANDGKKEPDEIADDEYWTQNLWVVPAAEGTRDIRIHAVNRDSQGYHHGYAIDFGPYSIANNPPPTRPGMMDVVVPNRTGDSTGPGVASNNTGNGNSGNGASTTGTSTSTTSNTATGSSGRPSGAGGGDGSSTGNATGSNTGSTTGNSSSGPGTGATTGRTTLGGTPPKPGRPTIEVSRRVVEPGETTTVPVYLRTPSGTANLNIEIRYDASIIQPIGDIVRGNALPGATLFSSNTSESGVIRLGFAGSGTVPADGTVAEIAFRAVGQRGQNSELPPAVTTINTASRQTLSPETITGGVSIVEKRIPGDSNGDGRLTAADALAALEMSVRLRPVELNLDMDNDNAVTSLDASLILRAAVGGTR